MKSVLEARVELKKKDTVVEIVPTPMTFDTQEEALEAFNEWVDSDFGGMVKDGTVVSLSMNIKQAVS